MGRPKKQVQQPEQVKVRCIRCGGYAQSNFYQTKDKNRKFYSKVPYCKNCVKELFAEYQKKYRDNHNLAFYYLCRKIDIPYIHSNYVGAMENIKNPDSKIYGEENFVSAYMKGFAFAEQNGWGYTFDDSQGEKDIEGIASYDEFTKVKKNKKVANSTNSDDYELIEYDTEYLQSKWGMFDNNDLSYLESEYLDWKDKLGGNISEKSIDIIVKQICLQSLDIQKSREQGDDVTKQIKTLRDLMSDGGLVEKQNQVSDIVNSSVGQRIEDIENLRPVYAPDPDLTDVDNMEKLIIGFAGATSRALGKNNYYTEKFEELYRDYSIDIIENLRSDSNENIEVPPVEGDSDG